LAVTAAAAVTLAGIGAIVALGPARRLAGVPPVTPYVTAGQSKAMASLESPILGVSASVPAARAEVLVRYSDLKRQLHGLRGFVVVGSQSFPRLNVTDAATILARFLAAAVAGVGDGYRVTHLKLLGVDMNAPTLTSLLAGERPNGVPLTELGAAVLAAARERNRLSLFSGVPDLAGVVSLPTFNALMSELAGAMDGVGYLVSGKPPPDPTVLGGIAYAGHAVGSFAAGLAGNAIGGLATAVVGSSVFWFAAIGLVAFRVLR